MNRLILVLCVALLSFSGFGQPGSKASGYDELLGKVKGGDLSIDFKTLRFAFADKTVDGPRAADPKIQGQMLALLNEKKFKEVVKLADDVHKTNFVDLNSHIMASMAYQGLQDPKKAKFHEAVYLGLVNSILKDADGNGPKTAYVVISIAEEYVLLNALELKRGAQTTESADGHNFHVLTATDKASNETVKVYFNVDKIPLTMSAVPKQP